MVTGLEVNKGIPSDSVAVGVPVRVIKRINGKMKRVIVMFFVIAFVLFIVGCQTKSNENGVTKTSSSSEQVGGE